MAVRMAVREELSLLSGLIICEIVKSVGQGNFTFVRKKSGNFRILAVATMSDYERYLHCWCGGRSYLQYFEKNNKKKNNKSRHISRCRTLACNRFIFNGKKGKFHSKVSNLFFLLKK